MKNNRSIPDSRRFYSSILFCSILLFFSIQPVNAQILDGIGLIPYQMDWNVAGLLPTTPTAADNLIIISDMAGATWDAKIQNAINLAAGQTGITIIYFPGGIYELTQPINLSYSDNESNIIFRGAGSNATILQFNIGNDGVCFNIEGTCGAPSSINNNINMYANTFVCSATTFDVGDWVHFRERTFPTEDGADVGQLTQITARDLPNNLYTIKDIAAKVYSTLYTLEVIEAFPITNIGIENLWIWRKDTGKSTENQNGCGHNIKFSYAVNCWVKGVQIDFTCRHHISIARSSHLEISGCYIHDAVDHGENNYGYGISLSSASTNCLIENNIFRMVRHAMGVGCGANSNCFVYNFSTEQYSTFNGIPYDDSDLCLHGRYSFSNLFEHNYVEWIEADTEHGDNGPYNAFFRNYVSRENNIQLYNATCSSVEGCESIPSGVYINSYSMPLLLDHYGYRNGTPKSHLEASSYPRSDFVLGDVSYYYSVTPDFLGSVTFPSIGPKRNSSSPLPTNDIPARIRFNAKNYTYLSHQMAFPATMPQTFSTGPATLTKIYENRHMTFYNNRHPVLASDVYICDEYELKADLDFCPSYSETPHTWLNQKGYSSDNPNYSNFLLVENSTTAHSNVATYFYFIKQSEQSPQAINKWSPYDPTALSPQYVVMGIPGVMTANGSLTHDENWCGTHTLTGNVTVPAGITLTVTPGTTVSIPANCRITIQGALAANSATFTRSGSSNWYGLYFDHANSASYLDDCYIKRASYGAYCNSSAPSIRYCTFEYNTYGINCVYPATTNHTIWNNEFFDNSSAAIRTDQHKVDLSNNYIEGSGNYGIYCNYASGNLTPYFAYNTIHAFSSGTGVYIRHSDPDFIQNVVYDTQDALSVRLYSYPDLLVLDWHNCVFANNSRYGIYIDATSDVSMGGLNFGYNSLFDNGADDVYSLQSYQIDATYNYWGTDLTPDCIGNINCGLILSTDPNPGAILKSNAVAGAAGQNSESAFGAAGVGGLNEYYIKARELGQNKQYTEAIVEFQYVIDNYPDSEEAKMSLVNLRKCYSKLKIPETIESTLKDVSTKFKDKKLGDFAEFAIIPSLVEDGKFKDALAIASKMSDKYTKTDFGRDAHFETFQNYFNLIKDLISARKEMEKYEKTYGMDENLISMKLALGDIDGEGVLRLSSQISEAEKLAKEADSEKNAVAEVLPKKFELSDNYPNPFNPITTIRFGLPEASHVQIRIYDTTGRLVATLADRDYQAGRFQVQFDASGLASGIYFSKVNMVSMEDRTRNRRFTGKLTLLK